MYNPACPSLVIRFYLQAHVMESHSLLKEHKIMQSAESSDSGITVKYIYSACIVTSSKDVTILHDPWFSEGIYDGS